MTLPQSINYLQHGGFQGIFILSLDTYLNVVAGIDPHLPPEFPKQSYPDSLLQRMMPTLLVSGHVLRSASEDYKRRWIEFRRMWLG